jgi:hypothetical protein
VAEAAALGLVRPAWALSCGCKSRRKETILIEVNRNCGRGDRPWGGSGERNRGPTHRNRIRGDAERGERAKSREAPMVEAQAA